MTESDFVETFDGRAFKFVDDALIWDERKDGVSWVDGHLLISFPAGVKPVVHFFCEWFGSMIQKDCNLCFVTRGGCAVEVKPVLTRAHSRL